MSGAALTHYRATLSTVMLGGEGRVGEKGRKGREERGGKGGKGRGGEGKEGREGRETTVPDYHVSSTCIIALLLVFATKSQGRGLMNTEHLSPIRDRAAASHLVPRYLDSCANWRHM